MNVVMILIININNHQIEVVILRKKIKNVYFRFKSDLKLYVSCNKYVDQNQILKLIKNNETSIYRMYNQMLKKNNDQKRFVILGDEYDVVIDPNVISVYIDGNKIFGKSNVAIEKYYLTEAKKMLGVRFERCYNLFSQLPICHLVFRKMVSRWGVCNTKLKKVTLNTELYRYDVSLIDYVIIHELCHFYEQNHSKKFWNEVSKYYPQYKTARKLLKGGI